jgi:hypothetical protein
MSSQSKAVSPLRQRMIEDMRMRKLAPHTQAGYIRAVRKFARYLNRSPDTATAEDLRNFQLHLVDHGASPITLNATITGLKFFFGVTRSSISQIVDVRKGFEITSCSRSCSTPELASKRRSTFARKTSASKPHLVYGSSGRGAVTDRRNGAGDDRLNGASFWRGERTSQWG